MFTEIGLANPLAEDPHCQLSHLSDDAAAALAQHDGRLCFYKLTDLSATAAAALARHKFNYTENMEYGYHAYVFVKGAYKLSPKVAKALGKHKKSPHERNSEQMFL